MTVRDNSYYIERLKRVGRGDLIEMINGGDISVYRACLTAGLRKAKDAPSRSEQIAFHWHRANAREKKRFIELNWQTVAPLVAQINKSAREKREAQKSSS